MRDFFAYLLVLILCCTASGQAQGPRQWPAPHQVDIQHAERLGIRRLAGRHLELFTDVPSSPSVDELPLVFDLAVDRWVEYFGIRPKVIGNWQVRGYLIRERPKFASLGVLLAGHENYLNGYALGSELWFDEQQSDYYRRHLFLHEGTHSFMLSAFGSAGPGWYMEGMAELLGTHRWEHHTLTLGIMPPDRESAALWGRVKLVREAVAAGRPLTLGQVLSIDNRQALSVEAYTWCWALCKFLDAQPRYSAKFHLLPRIVDRPDFTRRFRRAFRDQWSDLEFDWNAYIAELDYGYDFERAAVEHQTVAARAERSPFILAADRGWQATPWRLRAGQQYRVTAEGRYQIADDGQPWPCEPGGVTIRYHAGEPLGKLLGVLRPLAQKKLAQKKGDEQLAPHGDPFHPLPLGLSGLVQPAVDSQLYLRVNDSCAELSDNRGALTVRLELNEPADGAD